jgi:hypothetical protein
MERRFRRSGWENIKSLMGTELNYNTDLQQNLCNFCEEYLKCFLFFSYYKGRALLSNVMREFYSYYSFYFYYSLLLLLLSGIVSRSTVPIPVYKEMQLMHVISGCQRYRKTCEFEHF